MNAKICILLALVAIAQAQVPSLGRCPTNINAKQNFSAANYLGKWYEASKYFAIFQFGGKCVTATYSQEAGSQSVTVFNKQIGKLTNNVRTITGKAEFTEGPTVGKLGVQFPNTPVAPYWVLDTDYTNYAVVYSCTNGPLGLINYKFTWILTRTPNPTAETMQNAYAVLDKNGINRLFLLKTDQTNCPSDN